MCKPFLTVKCMTCFVCKHDVASTASACPNCGYRMPSICSTCKWYDDGKCKRRVEVPHDGTCDSWKYINAWL